VVIEDDAMFSDLIALTLREKFALTVLGQYPSVKSAIDGCLRSKPDLVVFDLHIVGGTGLDVFRHCSVSLPDTAWICLSSTQRPEDVHGIAEAGVCTIVNKRANLVELSGAIDALEERRAYYCAPSSKLLAEGIRLNLGHSALEDQIVARWRENLSATTIAEVEGVSEKTVYSHLAEYRKRHGLATNHELRRHP
jgi:DNA-binding NarL/FixJ family response regulator